MQGAQEEEEVAVLLSPNPFLNLQQRAGPETQRAEATAKITRQHLKQAPDSLADISPFLDWIGFWTDLI